MHTITIIWNSETEIESAKLLTAYPDTQIIPQTTPDINSAKVNLGSFLSDDIEGPVIFVEANLNPNVNQPLEALSVSPSVDVAYMSYAGTWHFPESDLNQAFANYGMPHTGLIYFKDVQTAKALSNIWSQIYQNTNKEGQEERAFLLALQQGNFAAGELDQDWIDFEGTNPEAYFNYLTTKQLEE
jgi:hypothetical protein